MHTGNRLSRRAFLKAGALTTIGFAAGCAAPAPVETRTPTAIPTLSEISTTTPPREPTETSLPTATETSTAASVSTATATSTPTATPAPAATATSVPTATPMSVATLQPTSTSAPPPTPTSVPASTGGASPARQDLRAHYPQSGQSVVALVQHDGVWSGEQIERNVVLQMLDAAITQLTGVGDALTAWHILFDPGERIAIKVNTISRYTTTPEVAYAVAQRLQDAGLPAEQIVLFDRTDWELRDRGFTINPDGPGVRCRGAKAWEEPVTVAGTTQRLHDVILSCDALINIPTLKEHGTSGFTSAMKNHYGTVNAPGQLHGNDCDPYIAELNALPIIRTKTRLIVGDFVRICPYDWNQMTKESKIAMSFDPVAHDWVARQVLLDRREVDGRPAKYIEGRSHYLDPAVKLEVGADPDHIEVRRLSLG
jgi:hypothetical protein